jgi:starch synthase (maltosyl-transferring)
MKPSLHRVVIENCFPVLENPDHYIKKTPGEQLVFETDLLADGHETITARLCITEKGKRSGVTIAMNHIENDRWMGTYSCEKEGLFDLKVEVFIDWPLSWVKGTRKKIEAGLNVHSELLEGAVYIETIQPKLKGASAKKAASYVALLQDESANEQAANLVLGAELEDLFLAHPKPIAISTSPTYSLRVEREKARFSTWYEFFPRSAGDSAHGTFKDCEKQLDRIADMGFDVLYLPPVHPIGEVNRKGKNNATTAEANDVGSPWGIGSKHGGHQSLHPELGSEADFASLVASAKDLGIEIAMDFALQAAPDHPWVKEHPQWFKWRPDGTVQYAENPPKKYQDILPIYFETPDWKNLWNELLATALYWVENFGIRIFRVDNPHTKPFAFWGWLIREVQKKYPEVLFLSEAFTRPKIMEQLGKQGFTQSYTYFTWRTSKAELTGYMNELTTGLAPHYFRPNFWPNTPDINPWHLQGANENMHMIRYALAATLSSNVGVYGPVFEHGISAAVPGKEEYLDSEKYQIRQWDWNASTSVSRLMTAINQARKSHSALQQTNQIQFLETANDGLLAYHKWSLDHKEHIIVVVSLDPYYQQSGSLQLPEHIAGRASGQSIRVTDLLTKNSYHWQGNQAFIELHPALPIHLFNVELL